ncbi:MAG TPA: hypothetical protein PLL33_05760 [Paracoccus sp. (in: a-proteobacteria)]|nr:hypothetical protein [Paracoccus sp. (in: a-proteobacteria)]
MPGERSRIQGMSALGIAALAALTVIGGLWLAGGPMRGRMERHDGIRMDDLRRLADHVSCLSDGSGMPGDIAETAGCPGPIRRADPFTGQPYRVEPLEGRKYRLCANFELPHEPDASWPGQDRDGDCVVFDLPLPVTAAAPG